MPWWKGREKRTSWYSSVLPGGRNLYKVSFEKERFVKDPGCAISTKMIIYYSRKLLRPKIFL
jgi:hypothetical protein